MQNKKKKYLSKLFNYSLLCLILLFSENAAANSNTEELILETYVQNYYNEDYAYVYKQSDEVYISLPQVAGFLGLKYNVEAKNEIVLAYADNLKEKYIIDFKKKKVYTPNGDISFTKQDYIIIDETFFLSADFWEKLIEIKIRINYLDMSLSFDRAEDFPMTKIRKAGENRQKGIYNNRPTPISEYAFDERYFATPVIDLTLNKGYSKYDGYTNNTDSYAVNVAMLAGGMDVEAYMTGGISDNDDSEIRIKGSRTFLEEPRNKLHLRTLEIGDISGLGNSYFTDSSYGRGINLSSFKDFVMSADKTIDITGPLTEGWQVELYWNDQLVGYRQNGTNGQYNFPDMPVSYGLNTFKLIFYGPYGEIKTKYERYYSGTSPVKKGEFGYTVSAYQPYKNLIEINNDNNFDVEAKNVFDFLGYYGLSDHVTLMGGYTQTPSANFELDQKFALTGVQYAIDGTSLQYNLEQNLDNNNVGHHIEWQGDIYIGQIYAGYDKYNNILSPLSSYGSDYIDEQKEIRLSGILPYNLPYYINYTDGKLADTGDEYNTLTFRLSKYINGLNLSIEDNYNKYIRNQSQNNIRLGVYKWWGDFSSESYLTIDTEPEHKLREFTTRLDYRTGRNTYLTGEYAHDFNETMDYLRLSAGQVFDFGGLTATFETDRDFNFSSYLTYNVSFTKVPEKTDLIINGNSKLSQTGTVYVSLFDENGIPLEGVGVNANGLEKQVYTDENGTALLTDLQTYEKTTLSIDMETLPDISLLPEHFERNIVLHPGTVRHIDIPFRRHGAIEGAIENNSNCRMFGYQVSVITENKEELSTYSDIGGYFILDNIPYGTYDLQISKDGKKITEYKNVIVDDIVVYINKAIPISASHKINIKPKNLQKQLQHKPCEEIVPQNKTPWSKQKINLETFIEGKNDWINNTENICPREDSIFKDEKNHKTFFSEKQKNEESSQ